MEAKDDELQTNFGATKCSICANFATCSWEPLTMLNPHFVAGEHCLFGVLESEDIPSIFQHIPAA